MFTGGLFVQSGAKFGEDGTHGLIVAEQCIGIVGVEAHGLDQVVEGFFELRAAGEKEFLEREADGKGLAFGQGAGAAPGDDLFVMAAALADDLEEAADKFETLAEGGEVVANRDGLGVGGGEEIDQCGFAVRAEGEDAEAGAVVEFEMGSGGVGGEFAPEGVDAEVAGGDGGVVKEDNGAIGELGTPGFEIMLDRIVGVEAIDVEEVDGGIFETGDGIVEGGRDERGKSCVERIVVVAQLVEN